MAQFSRISVLQARVLLQRESLLVVDVRDRDSFSQARIEGAHHLSFENFPTLRRSVAKDHPVLVYCYHGNASQDMAQMFIDFGFSEVYSMDGGFEAWRLENAG